MATGSSITTTYAASFIPEIWSRETLAAAERALVMAPLVKRYDAEVQSRGDTLHIPHVSNLTAQDKTQGSVVTRQYVSESSTTLSIDTWKEISFFVEDIVKIQSQHDLRSAYTEKAGYGIAQAVDTSILNQYSSLSSTDVGDYGSDITDSTIVAGHQTLDEVDAPLEDRAMVIAPSQKAAIMKLDKFVKADYLGQYDQATPVKRGPNNRYMWGEIYGTPTYYTNQVPVTAATPSQTHNLLFHKEAFALGLQMAPRVQAAYWLEELSWLVVTDVLYGVTVLRDTFGVEVRS